MRIVIVEDEALVAQRIERFTREILQERKPAITIKETLTDASTFLFGHPVDLLLLDLNLNGRDGFDLLRSAVSGAFHTIIISANTDKAVEAFEYGVLDFVPKPFNLERLRLAFERFERRDNNAAGTTKFLAVRDRDRLKLINVDDIRYIRGAGIYTELHLQSGAVHLHDKTLSALCAILPSNFVRIQKSYIANFDTAKHVNRHAGGKYDLMLDNGDVLPVSRTVYKQIKTRLS